MRTPSVPRRIASLVLALALMAGCYGDVPLAPSSDEAPAPTVSGPVVHEVETAPAPAEPPPPEVDPGNVTLHRLNRAEYDNTVRDLLGVDAQPAEDFPPDDHAYGFDNNADVLALSPVLMEFYERAAGDLIAMALEIPLLEPFDQTIEAEEADEAVGLVYAGVGVLLFTGDGVVTHKVEAPVDGTYRFSVRVWAEPSDDEPVRMRLTVDQKAVTELEVHATEDEPQIYEVSVLVDKGTTKLGVELANGLLIGGGDLRTLTVDWMRLDGPVDFQAPPADWVSPRDRLLVCTPADAAAEPACAREILESFAPLAWRRPVEAEEIDRLMALHELATSEGLGFEDAVAVPLSAVLVSPHFLFRVETDPDPTSPEVHPLTDHELAVRLSYFLWSSMPDAELLDLADQGALGDPAVLADQVDRMLMAPEADALIHNFVGQWLQTRHVDDVAPDFWYFPDFDDTLRASMREEAERFLQSFIDEDRPLVELLTATDTFVDDRLSEHYGLPKLGPGWHRVTVPSGQRGGILRQGAMLTVTSYPTRTSPVKRGKWVLDQLLCVEVPPPPAGVEGLVEPELGDEPLTLREQLEKHRADPTCAVCHAMMDPIGLGMEHYDGIGAWREEDAGMMVDASGELVDGRTFEGVGELAELLATGPELPGCVTEKLFTYALGRGPEAHDHVALDLITEDFLADGGSFRALATHIVLSDAFRLRRGESPDDDAREAAR